MPHARRLTQKDVVLPVRTDDVRYGTEFFQLRARFWAEGRGRDEPDAAVVGELDGCRPSADGEQVEPCERSREGPDVLGDLASVSERQRRLGARILRV